MDITGVKLIEEYLRGKTFYIATMDGLWPRVRPFGLATELNGRLYMATGSHKASYAQILANSNVEISVTGEGDEWLRLSGEAVYDYSDGTRDAMFERFPFIKGLYGKPVGPKLAPFYIDKGVAVFERMSGERREVRL